MGPARNDTALTVMIHVGMENSARPRFTAARALEGARVANMRELSPEEEAGGPLDLTQASVQMKEMGDAGAGPHFRARLLHRIERDRRDEDGGRGNIRLKKLSAKSLDLVLQRSWWEVGQTAAGRLPEFLLGKAAARVQDMTKLKEPALL